jgi:hypothetical protein
MKLHSTCLEKKSMLEFCEDVNKTSDCKEGSSTFLDQKSYQTLLTNILNHAYNYLLIIRIHQGMIGLKTV